MGRCGHHGIQAGGRVIARAALEMARTGLPSLNLGAFGDLADQVLGSHLEALDEIDRLRSAIQVVLTTLDANDDEDFDKALKGLDRIEGLQ